MPEKVAIVGSRRGASLESVQEFVRALYAMSPDTLLVSGGADGVDKTAEQTWLELGGRVWSYRVHEDAPNSFSIERWELGFEQSGIVRLIQEPTLAEYAMALFYRNTLIADQADRVVAFYRRGRSFGTQFTVGWAKDQGKYVHEYEAQDGERRHMAVLEQR